jgi:phosphonate transport system substrate-binding protein
MGFRISAGIHVLVLASCVFLTGCTRQTAPDDKPEATEVPARHLDRHYRFGVEPMRPVERLVERYLPLIDYLNCSSADFHLRLESALTYQTYKEKLRTAQLDIAIVEPHQVVEVETFGYQVFARAGRQDRISGVILVRRDGSVRSVRDLRGKTICFASPDALASTMLPRMRLLAGGLRPSHADFRFAASSTSAIFELLSGQAAAATSSRAAWETFAVNYPEAAAQIEVKWRSTDLPGSALMAHSRVPRAHVRQVARVLTNLHRNKAGGHALKHAQYTAFSEAESGSYDEVWEFMNAYQRFHRGIIPGGK